MKIIPLIMAGGAGTRLWPMSRNEKPKQFLNLSGKGTLLEETIKRLTPLKPETLIIATAKNYEELSNSEIKKSGINGVVLSEPRPKNTAAAVLYAAVYISKFCGDAVMIVLPADHYIKNADEFSEILNKGITQAENDMLVTIGIRPTYPETGYGYIMAEQGAGDVLKVDRFVEKPDLKQAQKYVDSGNYFWNSGMFIWKASVIIQSFREHLPGHIKAFQPLMDMSPEQIKSTEDEIWSLKEQIFNALDSVSIDYGILEKAKNRVVIPADFGWADLGSWKSIDGILQPDMDENRAPSAEHAIFVNSKKCSVFSEKSRISIIGLRNVVVVQAGDEILVMDKDASQDVRKVVEKIKKQ